MILSDSLNNKQKAAILHIEGPLRIIAGPGSGKTEVLTRKIAYLTKSIGYNPKKILGVTFTNKAANTMKSRLRQMIGEDSKYLLISTFHSLAVRIIREGRHYSSFGTDFKIIDSPDQKRIIRLIFKELEIEPRRFSVNKIIDYIQSIKIKEKDLEDVKNNLHTDVEKIIFQIYQNYEKKRIEMNAFDFNDLLLHARNLLKNNNEYLQKWSKKFDYILVDEFQDTSQIQYEIIQYLTFYNKNITVVGDLDQTIYTWRGADVNIFLNFSKHFPGTTTIKMVQNYRSTKVIVETANTIIKHNSNRIKKDIITENEKGEKIAYYQGANSNFEAKWIVNQIKMLRKTKSQLKDIAVLYRSNFISQNIEKALVEEGIEYKIFGGIKFFQRTEIKDAIAFLGLINNFKDDTFLERVINVPSRKLGSITKEMLFKNAKKINKSVIEYIKINKSDLPFLSKLQKNNIFKFINAVLKHHVLLKHQYSISLVLKKFLQEINYFRFLDNTDSKERSENLYELIESLSDFEAKSQNQNLTNKEKINNYLQEIALSYSQDEISEIVDFVSLMTVHTSKGLEFANVFIAGFSDGIFPTWQSLKSVNPEALEEERRLAYVAITRAKNRLFISDSKGYSVEMSIDKKPSRFIHELGIEDAFKDATQIFSFKTIQSKGKEFIDFTIGDKIKHIRFGFGEVVAIYDDFIDVVFAQPFGLKSLLKNHESIERE